MKNTNNMSKKEILYLLEKYGLDKILPDVEKMVGALLTVWKLSDVGNDVLIQIETAMVDGTPLIDAIEDVLRFHGAELAE
jgi:hypothetical protein